MKQGDNMKIFPAIDVVSSQVVRLTHGDFNSMKVYSPDPADVARVFKSKGAECVHIVDLEGAKTGLTPNFEVISKILKIGLFSEVGGGIRDKETVKKYLDAGANRVILSTAAIENPDFLSECINDFGERIAVGADVSEGKIAVRGWLENSNTGLTEFAEKIQSIGVRTLICTDISRDGEMRGANLELYRQLTSSLNLEIIASGGVTNVKEIKELKNCGAAGAIIGKAWYEGLISLEDAIDAAK